MANPPTLLNDDGTASVATALMMSHHAFRRDLARFARVLDQIADGDLARAGAVRSEWANYHGALHDHHQHEDTSIFPAMREQHRSLAETIDRLTADHRRIDPVLERGDREFAETGTTATGAHSVVRELSMLLEPHLALEEAEIIPLLREAKQFPPPANDSEAAKYADGFAWSCEGIADEVLVKLHEILPAAVIARLPAARATFAKRLEATWGAVTATQSRTPVPG